MNCLGIPEALLVHGGRRQLVVAGPIGGCLVVQGSLPPEYIFTKFYFFPCSGVNNDVSTFGALYHNYDAG